MVTRVVVEELVEEETGTTLERPAQHGNWERREDERDCTKVSASEVRTQKNAE